MQRIVLAIILLLSLGVNGQVIIASAPYKPIVSFGSTKVIQVNLYGNSDPSGLSGWNDWNFIPSPTSPSFLYTDASSSSITATCDATNYGQNADGYVTSPMCPNLVGKYAAKPAFGDSVVIVLNNLNNAKTYDIDVYCSFHSGFEVSTTVGILGGSSFNFDTNDNNSFTASFTGLTPSSGHITFYSVKSDWFGYINGFKITEH